MTRKIFRSILTVGVAVLACSLLLVMGCFYSFYEGMQEHQLGDELRIAAAAVETNGSTYLEKIKSDRFRVTWIASDGTVLYDTQADAAQMENHLEREEVRDARYGRRTAYEKRAETELSGGRSLYYVHGTGGSA